MFELLLKAWYLQFPVVVGGVLHMLAVTRQWLPGLTVPIYTPWFGANKTWRGLLLMPLLSALVVKRLLFWARLKKSAV